jgi:hypothetical protein
MRGKTEVARNLLAVMNDAQIADMTDLMVEAVAELRTAIKLSRPHFFTFTGKTML